MKTSRTLTTTVVALALAVLLALPATAGTHASMPLPTGAISDLLDRLAGNPLADCLPDLTEADHTDVDGEQLLLCVLDALPDIVGNAHASAIVAVVTAGIASGFADGTFGPQLAVTRGQMATFLARALELAPGQASGLSDVAGTHAEAIHAVVGAGIAQGFADGTFRPNQPVTRAQMATFLDRALELVPDQAATVLSDVMGNAHAQAINAVVGAGIAQGFPDGTFRPNQPVTRGQMATFLDRSLNL